MENQVKNLAKSIEYIFNILGILFIVVSCLGVFKLKYKYIGIYRPIAPFSKLAGPDIKVMRNTVNIHFFSANRTHEISLHDYIKSLNLKSHRALMGIMTPIRSLIVFDNNKNSIRRLFCFGETLHVKLVYQDNTLFKVVTIKC